MQAESADWSIMRNGVMPHGSEAEAFKRAQAMTSAIKEGEEAQLRLDKKRKRWEEFDAAPYEGEGHVEPNTRASTPETPPNAEPRRAAVCW